MLDVAIIGAGPVGLATAAAVLKAQSPPFRVQVFERASDLRPCGAGFFILSNGFRALNAIDPKLYAQVLDMTVPMDAFNQYAPDGTVTRTAVEALNSEEKYGFPSMMATGWSDLRQTLVDWLPIDTVQLGKQFTSLEQHDDHAVVHFADGSHAKAQIVIGADGVFSKVRQQNLADGPPDFTGMTTVRAVLPLQEGFPKSEVHMFRMGTFIGNYYPISKGNCVWSFITPTSSDVNNDSITAKDSRASDATKSSSTTTAEAPLSAHQRSQALWADGPSLMVAAMAATAPDTVLEHKLNIRHPSTLDRGHWGVGGVTLVGDAAHAMRAISGQGLNQGLEDAAALGHHLQTGGLCPETLRAFEASRILRVQEIMAAEMAGALAARSKIPAPVPKELSKYKYATQILTTSSKEEYQDWLLQGPLQ